MSRWQEQFDSHPIHATLIKIKELASNEMPDAPPESIPETRRILKIISTFENALKQLDPEIAPFPQIDSLNSHLTQQVLAPLTQYAQNKNVGHLTNANNQFSSQLVILSYFFPAYSQAVPQAPTQEIEALFDTTSFHIAEKAQALDIRLTGLSEEIVEQKTLLDDLSSLIETRKQDTDARLSEWQKQFSEAQENRSSEFNSWREKVDDKAASGIQALIDKANGDLEAHSDQFKNEITSIILDAGNKHQAILDLYELTAGDSVAAGYLKSANNEGKQADFWRWASILFISATAVWLVSAYSLNTGANDINGINWHKLLMTFSLSGVLLWGSAYAAQQSTKHRNSEKKTRWFALEIKAIDPFISSLDAPTQNTLKKQLSERLFAQSTANDDDTRVIDEHALNIVANTIAKILDKLPKT